MVKQSWRAADLILGGEGWGTPRGSHSLLVGMQDGTATLEDSLAVSYKTKHTLTIQSSNDTHWYLPKGIEN